jgi:rhamnosyl/mannosyltransferase
MIRLLLVTKLFEPVFGGVETVVGQIASSLLKSGDYQVTILAGNEQPSINNTEYLWKGITVIKTASAGMIYHTALSPSYIFTLKRLIRENDIIHFHVPNPLGELAFSFSGVPPTKKVIVTVHADISQTRKSLYAPVYNFFLKKLLDRANKITITSPENRTGFPVLKDYLEKCAVIPPSYNENLLMPVTESNKIDFIKTFGIDPSKPVLLFAGRLSEDKGLEYLLHALKRVGDVQLLIVGNGPLLPILQKQAAEIKQSKIIFTGFLTGLQLACAYSIARLFVLPSIKETFGMVLTEALYFGLPVVNTQLNTGVNYVSPHNITGLTVPPANAQALSSAIQAIMYDEDLYRKFSINARERSKLFAPEVMAGSFDNLYKS